MNREQREQIMNDYAQSILEGMDMETMERFVFDALMERLETYSEEDLVNEVRDYYPYILGEN